VLMTCHFLFIYYYCSGGFPVWVTGNRLLVEQGELYPWAMDK
jgi:hypothetical protein